MRSWCTAGEWRSWAVGEQFVSGWQAVGSVVGVSVVAPKLQQPYSGEARAQLWDIRIFSSSGMWQTAGR